MNTEELQVFQRCEHERNTAWAWAMDNADDILDLAERMEVDEEELSCEDDEMIDRLVFLVVAELWFKKAGHYNPDI